MKRAHVRATVIEAYKSGSLTFWFIVRMFSALGPLTLTYIFASGVAAFENGLGFDSILKLFLLFLFIESLEHLLRILSKTRINSYNEGILIDIQEELVGTLSSDSKKRKEAVQSFRNLTQSLRLMVNILNDVGIQGIVSFVLIPLILLAIDMRIFYIELVLIAVYILITYIFTNKYEKRFERFDQSRENYYSALLARNDVEGQASIVRKNVWDVENLVFLGWLSLQNLVSVFQILIFIIVAQDILGGVKQISDLVLVYGYTKESKVFLNQVTNVSAAFMQVKAGVERVVAITDEDFLEVHNEHAK